MSIIQIKDRVTNDELEFQKYRNSINSHIFTTAKPENLEENSIELTLGDGWNDNFSPVSQELRRIKNLVEVFPHGSIVVEVEEDIKVPNNKYGIIISTGSLFLSKGVLVASAKVEPRFHGKLLLRLFNTTNSKITIKKGDKLGSVVFFQTEFTNEGKSINRDRKISENTIKFGEKSKEWLKNNPAIWQGLPGNLFVALLTISFTYAVWYGPSLKKKDIEIQKIQIDLEKKLDKFKQEIRASSQTNISQSND